MTSSTRRTDTPARYISMRDSSTDDSLRLLRSMMAVSKQFRDGDITEACLLLVQLRVERVLDSAPDERFQVVLESGIVDFSGRDPLVEFAKGNMRYLAIWGSRLG